MGQGCHHYCGFARDTEVLNEKDAVFCELMMCLHGIRD